jgi:hypothetical protein
LLDVNATSAVWKAKKRMQTNTQSPTTMSDSDRTAYDHKPSLKYASLVGLQAGAVGAFVSTIQNALSTHSHGAMGFVTRTGATIGFFGARKSFPFLIHDLMLQA